MSKVIYFYNDAIEAVENGCDLGDSVGVRAYKFPHVDQLQYMTSFVPASELEALAKKHDSLLESFQKLYIERHTKPEVELKELKSQLQDIEEFANGLDDERRRNRKRIEELEVVISHLPKVPTQPYEKELAQKIVELETDLRMVKEIGVEGQRRVNERQSARLKSAEDMCERLANRLDVCVDRLRISYHTAIDARSAEQLRLNAEKAKEDLSAYELWKKERVNG